MAVEGFVVIVAVLFGSVLFGVLGAILAIPVAASLQIVWREYRDYRRESVVTATQPAAGTGPAGSASPEPA